MTTPRELLNALGPTIGATSERYAIRATIEGAFVARAPSSRACLLIPTRPGKARPIGRVSGNLRLSFPASVLFDINARRWEAPCAVVECLDDALVPAFCALSVDVAERLTRDGRTPVPADVTAALADWERLLRSRRRLSDTEEMGLWGELLFLDQMPDLDVAVRSWRGPFGDAVDFLASGVGIECKTSKQRLQHHVSLGQAHRPLGGTPIFFVSQWVGVDARGGKTVNDLVRDIGHRTTEPIQFERALLAAGYAAADASMYTTRFVLLEASHWFAADEVPRVRQIDAGITQVRYVVQLDDLRALEEAAAAELTQRLFRP